MGFSLFLHPDWTRIGLTVPPGTKVTIPFNVSSPRLLSFLSRTVAPVTLVLYGISSAISAAVLLPQWRILNLDPEGTGLPCLEKAGDAALNRIRVVFSLMANVLAVGGFSFSIAVLWKCSLGRPFCSYVAWWVRRNYAYGLWCLTRSGFSGYVDGVPEIGTIVVTVVSGPVFAGIEFVLLLLGGPASAVKQMYRVFYLLNGLSSILSYVNNLFLRNQCNKSLGSSLLVFVVNELFVVATAGQLLAVVKIHWQKLRDVEAPVLPYGLASHVSVSLPERPGEPCEAVLSPDNVGIGPTVGGLDQPRRGGFLFRSPDGPRFRRHLTVWAVVCFVWVVLAATSNIAAAERHRAVLSKRCWVSHPRPLFVIAIDIGVAILAVLIIAAQAAIVVGAGLTGLMVRWISFTYRRNWIFVVLAFARGLVDFRPGVPRSSAYAAFVNFSIILQLALASTDLLLLLSQSLVFRMMYRGFVLQQIVVSVTAYIEGLSTTFPCDLSLKPKDRSQFFLRKAQSSVQLFFSLFFLGKLLSAKIFSPSIETPLLKLSDSGRFVREQVDVREQLEKV